MKWSVDEPLTLMEALKKLFPNSSNRTLKQWIKWKRVLVNQKAETHPTKSLEVNQTLMVLKKDKKHGFFKIIYEDPDFVVIDKPNGLLSVPSEDKSEPSAWSYLQEHYRYEIFAVHRLDRHASGLLLFAKNKKGKEAAITLFAEKKIQRHYLAICEGRIPQDQGMWDKTLLELPNYDVVYHPDGVKAFTYFKVYRRSRKYSFLYLSLGTGKKHQIRVHCKEAGHPICGDHRYGSFESPCDRLCLHAIALTFKHPFNQKTINLESRIPPSFYRLGASIGFEEVRSESPIRLKE